MKQTTRNQIRQVSLNDLRQDLKAFEAKYGMSSAEFHAKFERGEVEDSEDMLEWAGEDFDPEAFDLVEINKTLWRLR